MEAQNLENVRLAVQAARNYWLAFMDARETDISPRVEEIEETSEGFRIVLSIPAPAKFTSMLLTGEAVGKEHKTFFVTGQNLRVTRMVSGVEPLAS